MKFIRWIKSLVRDMDQRRLFNKLLQHQRVFINNSSQNELFIEYINNIIIDKTIFTDMFIPDLMNELKSSKQDLLILHYSMNKRYFGRRVQNLSSTLFDLKYRLYDISIFPKTHNTTTLRFVYIMEGSTAEIDIQKNFFFKKIR
jgi:hypothetical protein